MLLVLDPQRSVGVLVMLTLQALLVVLDLQVVLLIGIASITCE
jgi:hypothetical protein